MKGSKTKTAKINADAFWFVDDWQEWKKSYIGNKEHRLLLPSVRGIQDIIRVIKYCQTIRTTHVHNSNQHFIRHLNWILPFAGLLRCAVWSRTDVSGPPIGPTFEGQAVVLGQIDPWRRGPIGSPETSILNQTMLRNSSAMRLLQEETRPRRFEVTYWMTSSTVEMP